MYFGIYVQGAQILLTSVEKPPVVREGIKCNSPVEFAYYFSKKFKNVCAHCGNDDCTIYRCSRNSFRLSSPFVKNVVPVAKNPKPA